MIRPDPARTLTQRGRSASRDAARPTTWKRRQIQCAAGAVQAGPRGSANSGGGEFAHWVIPSCFPTVVGGIVWYREERKTLCLFIPLKNQGHGSIQAGCSKPLKPP